MFDLNYALMVVFYTSHRYPPQKIFQNNEKRQKMASAKCRQGFGEASARLQRDASETPRGQALCCRQFPPKKQECTKIGIYKKAPLVLNSTTPKVRVYLNWWWCYLGIFQAFSAHGHRRGNKKKIQKPNVASIMLTTHVQN